MHQQRVRIKMCGMTRKEDIACAIDCGIDAIGLIFYPKSNRYISIENAKLLVDIMPLFVTMVAVLVNPSVYEVEKIIKELPVQCLQFHGEESPEFCAQFNKPYIKSVAALTTNEIQETVRHHTKASAILLDTPSLQHRGGSGLSFDWNIIPKIRDKPIILAGGLNASNIAVAIAATNPYAVDVCSGIEQFPGIKDHEKMHQFVKAIRGNYHEQ